jgi:hypothetical protein
MACLRFEVQYTSILISYLYPSCRSRFLDFSLLPYHHPPYLSCCHPTRREVFRTACEACEEVDVSEQRGAGYGVDFVLLGEWG